MRQRSRAYDTCRNTSHASICPVTLLRQIITHHLHIVHCRTSANGKNRATVAPVTQLNSGRRAWFQVAAAAAAQYDRAAEQLAGAAAVEQQQLPVRRRARNKRDCGPRLLLIATSATLRAAHAAR